MDCTQKVAYIAGADVPAASSRSALWRCQPCWSVDEGRLYRQVVVVLMYRCHRSGDGVNIMEF